MRVGEAKPFGFDVLCRIEVAVVRGAAGRALPAALRETQVLVVGAASAAAVAGGKPPADHYDGAPVPMQQWDDYIASQD